MTVGEGELEPAGSAGQVEPVCEVLCERHPRQCIEFVLQVSRQFLHTSETSEHVGLQVAMRVSQHAIPLSKSAPPAESLQLRNSEKESLGRRKRTPRQPRKAAGSNPGTR